MTKNEILERLTKVENLAKGSKLKRLIHHPFRYADAIIFKEFIYPKNKNPKKKLSSIFTGQNMYILLPAATDIYLTGGKSHYSEIRLARFLIRNLKPDSIFLDIGAHYGYFSLVASSIIEENGKILAVEAAPNTFEILKENCIQNPKIHYVNSLVSDSITPAVFYQFSNKYSEYNTLDIAQFEHESWYQTNIPEVVALQSNTIHTLIKQHLNGSIPDIIKIDVEGAEERVILGGVNVWEHSDPIVIMEYLSSNRNNTAHKNAATILKKYGFNAYSINDSGQLHEVHNIDDYLLNEGTDSDNIVFKKRRIN